MNNTMRRIWIRLVDERGASMVEYSLLIALIAMVALVAVALFGTSLRGNFQDSTQQIIDAT